MMAMQAVRAACCCQGSVLQGLSALCCALRCVQLTTYARKGDWVGALQTAKRSGDPSSYADLLDAMLVRLCGIKATSPCLMPRGQTACDVPVAWDERQAALYWLTGR